MKKFSRILALLLALCLALPVAMAENTETAVVENIADPVLFTFDGEEVYLSQVDSTMYELLNGGYLSTYDYETVIDYIIQNMLAEKQIKALGLDQITAEEEEAFRAEAQKEWDAAVETYMVYFLSEDTEEGRQLAKESVEQAFYSQGINVDVLVENMKKSAAMEKLYEMMMQGKDISVTEEEVKAVFQEYAAQDQAMYEGNAGMYEMYTSYYGYASWYIPEGFRGIIHILLEVDEELMTAYTAAQAGLEEEPVEGEENVQPVTQADVDAALNAILDSRKEDIDAIYNWLQNGETFENLIKIYGTDPGMQDETMLKEGYAVHQESIMWDPVFTAAAFSEKMQKPGDVSDPVVGSYGIHILYYLRDIPGGIVELSEEIYAEVESYLTSQKESAAYSEMLAAWAIDTEIVYNEEAIADAIASVSAAE